MDLKRSLCPAAEEVGVPFGPPRFVCQVMLSTGQQSPRFGEEDCNNYTSCSVWRHDKQKKWSETTGRI